MQHTRKTVLLTGSRGFTGKHVRAVLERENYRVIGLVDDDPHEDELRGDLRDLASLVEVAFQVQPDFVLHLAAIAFVGHSDPLELYQVNLFGTLNLLQALHNSGAKPVKVVLASSANIYGANPVCPVSESFLPAPVNHYAMSKLAMEYLAHTWFDRLPIIITRPFNYTGPGQSEQFLAAKIVSHCVTKQPVIRLGNLDIEREFNDVRSVAHIYLKLMENAPAGTTVNICTGVGHKLWDVLRQAEAITGHHLEVEVAPELVRNNELRVLVGDPSLMKSFVGALDIYSLQDTLAAMVAVAAKPA